jgi:hypothetical protein
MMSDPVTWGGGILNDTEWFFSCENVIFRTREPLADGNRSTLPVRTKKNDCGQISCLSVYAHRAHHCESNKYVTISV